jgi:hypothetical protein
MSLLFVHQVTAVLVYAHQNNVEPFLEPVLDLSQALLQKDMQAMVSSASKGEQLARFLQHLPVFMDLCTHADSPVAIAASVCLSQLVSQGVPRGSVGWQPRLVCWQFGVANTVSACDLKAVKVARQSCIVGRLDYLLTADRPDADHFLSGVTYAATLAHPPLSTPDLLWHSTLTAFTIHPCNRNITGPPR